MGSFDRVNRSTKYRKKRRGFQKRKETSSSVNNDVNNTVNTAELDVNSELNNDQNFGTDQDGYPSSSSTSISVSAKKVQQIEVTATRSITG